MEKLKKQSLLSPVVLLVFLIGISLSFFLHYLSDENIKEQFNQKFEYLITKKTNVIQQELDINLQVLQSIKSFFNSSTFVDREEFREFVKIPLKKYKSIQALEWIPIIKKEDRKKYEELARKELSLDFNIVKKSDNGKMLVSEEKDTYYPVYYLEPLKGNEKVLGFDVGSNNKRLKSLIEAKENKTSSITGRITLIQEKAKQFGFLVFEPISIIENKTKQEGFALGVYRIGDIVNSALNMNKIERNLLNIWLIDTTNKSNPQLLHTNTNLHKVVTSNDFKEIKLGDRTWTLYAKPSHTFIENNSSSQPFIIFLTTLFISTLISYIVAIKVSKAEHLEEIEIGRAHV